MRLPITIAFGLTTFVTLSSAICADETEKAKARPPVIEGLELKVVVKENDIGEVDYYARFMNRGEKSRFIVGLMDGSTYGLSMPHYLMTAKDEAGKPLEMDSRICNIVGQYGLYAETTWPDDYVSEVKPGENFDVRIGVPFELTEGKTYEFVLNYTYVPSEEVRANLKIPKNVDIGVVRGTPVRIVAPHIEQWQLLFKGGDPDSLWKELKGVDDGTVAWLKEIRKGTTIISSVDAEVQLRELCYYGGTLEETELQHLKKLKQLKWLFIADAKIENTQLSLLKSLDELVFVHVADSDLNDHGLKHLQQLTGLRRLVLKGTGVSEAAIAAFRKARPDVNLIEEKKKRDGQPLAGSLFGIYWCLTQLLVNLLVLPLPSPSDQIQPRIICPRKRWSWVRALPWLSISQIS